jgi:hypothetical protein
MKIYNDINIAVTSIPARDYQEISSSVFWRGKDSSVCGFPTEYRVPSYRYWDCSLAIKQPECKADLLLPLGPKVRKSIAKTSYAFMNCK